MDLHINLSRQNVPSGSNPLGIQSVQTRTKTTGNDVVVQSQQKTKSLIQQVMRKAVDMESSFTDLIDQHAKSITANKKAMDSSYAGYRAAREQKTELIAQYGLSSEDAALLDKNYYAQTNPAFLLSEEEHNRLEELRQDPNICEYESQVAALNESMDFHQGQLQDAIKNIKMDMQMVESVKMEHLKVNVMGTANREIDAIKESTARELVGDLVNQAKEHLDEQMEEIKEKQEERQKEDERQEKLQEKRKTEKAEEPTGTNNQQDMNQQLEDADTLLSETEAAVTEINEKLKKLEELLTGANVNTYV